jgi:hypothetical protein
MGLNVVQLMLSALKESDRSGFSFLFLLLTTENSISASTFECGQVRSQFRNIFKFETTSEISILKNIHLHGI